MNWNFGKLEESVHCWKPQLQVLILLCCFYSCSKHLQELWIIIYFRLRNLKSSNVHEWICLRMGFYGFAHRNRSIFQEQPFWPQKTSFAQFLAAVSPGWVVWWGLLYNILSLLYVWVPLWYRVCTCRECLNFKNSGSPKHTLLLGWFLRFDFFSASLRGGGPAARNFHNLALLKYSAPNSFWRQVHSRHQLKKNLFLFFYHRSNSEPWTLGVSSQG
jgi:hypothetical protein